MEVGVEERLHEIFSTEKYRLRLSQLAVTGGRSIQVDFEDIIRFDPELAKMLVEKPDVYLRALERAALDQLRIEAPEYAEEIGGVRVRLQRLPENLKVSLRRLGAKHINRLVRVEGIIVRSSPVKPLVVKAAFRCKSCEHVQYVMQTGMLMRAPSLCEACKKRGPFEFVESESEFIDYQELRVQEKPEDLPPGQLPRWLNIRVYDELVDVARPGDTVAITGIVRAVQESIPRTGKLRTFTITLEVNNLEVYGKGPETVEITPEEERLIIELSKEKDIHEKIKRSIAPSIYGYDDIKEAIMYLLFGGTPKVLPDGTRIRGDINILLVGDPGTGKCVSGDSLIVLHDGTICEIRKVVDSTLTQETKHIISDGYYVETNHKLLSLDVNGSITEKVSSIFWKRRCPEYIYEVKTRTGKKIKVTPTHPFFTIKDGSIVPIQASELRTGDFIATPRRLRVFGRPQRLHIRIKRGGTNAARIKIPETTSPELCRILGYLLGEGCCYKASTYHVIFTNRNTELRRDFSYCFEKVFGLTPRSPPSHRGKDLWISSVEVGRFLEKLIPSIFQGAARKEIPEVITRCSDLEIAHLIRAYFDSDATVSTKEREIVITSASEKLLRQVQLLLLRFGVLSQLKEKKVKGKTYFRLRISGEDILNYAKYIGFLHPEKRRRLLSLVSATKTFNTNLDVVPGVYSLIKRIRLKLRLNRSSYTTPSSLKHYENGDRNPSRKCLSNIVDYFTNRLNELIKIRDEIEKAKNWRQLRIIRRKLRLSQKELASIIGVDQTLISQYELGKIRSLNEELLLRAKKIMRKLCDTIILDPEIIMGIARLKMLSDSHIFWDMVSEVKKVKSKDEWVYDMQVDETHNFIANGFFVHNSQLLQYVQRISPRGLYTHGRGTTAAGLTAAVVREKGGGMVLEAGALVLADQGVCAIDEIDKMRPEDRVAMHQAMEQQSISVAKGGIVATLNARAAILAAANPALGRYDPNRTVAENINLPVTLLSRFDLIFVLKDRPDKERDARLTEHILRLHGGFEEEVKPVIEPELLRKYISYSKRIKPRMTEEAMEIIKDFY
ncbi:hypothetical protein DRO58_04805, partial [Candidatus Bathyarchaeota archaeon]